MGLQIGLIGIKTLATPLEQVARAFFGADARLRAEPSGVPFAELVGETRRPLLGQLNGWTLIGDETLACEMISGGTASPRQAVDGTFRDVSRYALYRYDTIAAVGWAKWRGGKLDRRFYVDHTGVLLDEGEPLSEETLARRRTDAKKRPKWAAPPNPYEYAEATIDLMSGLVCPEDYSEGNGFFQEAIVAPCVRVRC